LDCSDFAASNLVSLLIGVVSSFLTWWGLFHWLVPKVEFSPFIGKAPRTSGSGYSYRIKFINTGLRPIIGVEVYARLWISWKGDGNWVGTYIPFSGEGEIKYDVPILERKRNRVLSFFINSVEGFRTNPAYSTEFRAKATNKVLTMEDLLSQGKESYVRVFVSGFDSFSGARRVFQSRKFYRSDIYPNRFAVNGLGLGVLAAESDQANESPPAEDAR